MSIFYISGEDGKIYSFDATETFSIREAGSLTEYTIESGSKVSDHYVNENKEIATTGIITDIKTPASLNPLSCEEFIKGILDLKASKKPFKVYWRDASNLMERFFNNVMFVDVSFNQDSSAGFASGSYAYRVSFAMKQIQFSDRAVITREMVPALKSASTKQKTSNVTTRSATNTLPTFLQTNGQPKPPDPNSIYVNSNLQKIKYGPAGRPQ